MKTIKRIFTLLLSLSIIISGITVMAEENKVVSAPAEETPQVVALESKALDILNAMGFIGEDVLSLNGDQNISRAQFVGILSKVAGFNTISYKTSEIKFIDVSPESPYRNEICYFSEAGIINGTSSNTFSPNAPITYQQATKVISDVLGYKDFAQTRFGNDLNAYVAMAHKLELTDDLQISDTSAPLSAQNAIKLLYNAGCAPVFDAAYYEKDGNITYNNWNGVTLFEKNNKFYFSEGLIQSNGVVSLLSENVNDKAATINGVEYLLSGFDLTSLIGCHVEFYYSNINNIKTLLWAGLDKKNNLLDIDAYDLAFDDPNYTKERVIYLKNKKHITVKISPYADFIYNNALYNNYTIRQIQPRMGNLRLIDNNNDNIYDLVVATEYKNIYTTNVLSGGPYIGDKYNNSLDFSKYENVKIYNKDGKEINYDAIGSNAAVSVVEDDNKKYLIAYVGSDFYQDKLIEMYEEDGATIMKFEKMTTKLSRSYDEIDTTKYFRVEPRLGKSYRYYLDKDGNVAEIQEIIDGILDYAYFIRASIDEDPYAEPNTVEFRFLLSNGNFANAKSHKYVKLDGTSKKSGMDIYNDTRLWKDNDKTAGVFEEQVVKITINGDGELTEFQFAYDNTANPYGHCQEKFSLDYSASGTYNTNDSLRMLANRYFIDGSTLCFVKLSGLNIEDPYALIAGNDVNLISSKTYKIYDAGTDFTVPILAGEHSANRLGDEKMFLVSEIKHKKVEGEYVKHLCGYYGSGYIEIPEIYEGIIPADTKRGDVLRIGLHQNKLSAAAFQVRLDGPDKSEPTLKDGFPNIIYSYVYSASPRAIALITPQALESSYGKVIVTGFKSGSKLPVTVFDRRNDTMFVADAKDVFPNISPMNDGSIPINDESIMAVVSKRGTYASEIIVVYN